MLNSSGQDVLSLFRGDRSSKRLFIYELRMLSESVKIVIQVVFGIAASAVIIPQRLVRKLLEGPGGRGREYLVSSMSGLIGKCGLNLLVSLLWKLCFLSFLLEGFGIYVLVFVLFFPV
jgi:hypothetical protein